MLVKFEENPKWLNEAGKNGKRLVEKEFNRKNLAFEYLHLLYNEIKI